MGQPADDIARLAEALELLSRKGLHAQRIRVGSVEIDGIQLLVSPPRGAEDDSDDAEDLTRFSPEELQELARKEFESIQYAASGPE